MRRWLLYPILLVGLLVTLAHAASVVLTWTLPTTHEDGTPLSDLSSISVYQGTASGQYEAPMSVGIASSAIMSGLTEGQTYYWVVTALDHAGNESADSNEVSVTIQASPSDTTLPSVALTSPAAGNVPRNRDLTIEATASDNVGVIRVEFWTARTGAPLERQCTVGTPPYRCRWHVPSPRGRTYTIEARAIDAAGEATGTFAVARLQVSAT
jgi:hypothetical protein